MFTIDELLSNRNQAMALSHLKTKKNGKGLDGVLLSELEEYWNLNKEMIISLIRNQEYEPGIIKNTVIINGKGKQRVISSLNAVDRLITRMIAQKLNRYISEYFLDNSFAYQDNKGILNAVKKAQKYMKDGYTVKVEIDVQNFFDDISIERMLEIIKKYIHDPVVFSLIESYLYCTVSTDGEISKKTKGLIQGSPISPILSNLYLNDLDEFMEINDYHWIRYADDINIFASTKKEALEIYRKVKEELNNSFLLKVNEKKSGIFNAFERRMLGYDFYLRKGNVEIKKHTYEVKNTYYHWHECSIQKVNHEYHLIKNGILNKQDFSLLFENEDEKHHIPVEVVDQINIYNNITISKNVLQTLSDKKIRLCFMNKYGEAIGYYVPAKYSNTALMNQCKLYMDLPKRMKVSKLMEVAAIHNLRCNLRYYIKKGRKLQKQEKELSKYIKEIDKAKSIDQLMLIEARARQLYYSCFNEIIQNDEFRFDKRTRRPPENALNALISFGNTLLYNAFLKIIWKTSLDPHIGCIHATNRRSYSLNLDFADIFKPIVVDRIIFSIIHRMQVRPVHFQKIKEHGIYMTEEGKKLFVEQFERKLNTKITIKGFEMSYYKLLEKEVYNYQHFILKEKKYSPYKYY